MKALEIKGNTSHKYPNLKYKKLQTLVGFEQEWKLVSILH